VSYGNAQAAVATGATENAGEENMENWLPNTFIPYFTSDISIPTFSTPATSASLVAI